MFPDENFVRNEQKKNEVLWSDVISIVNANKVSKLFSITFTNANSEIKIFFEFVYIITPIVNKK